MKKREFKKLSALVSERRKIELWRIEEIELDAPGWRVRRRMYALDAILSRRTGVPVHWIGDVCLLPYPKCCEVFGV